MPDSKYLRDKMAAVITEATHVSMHSDDPAGTGANEISGGDPAYARVAITSWAVSDVTVIDGVPVNGGVYVATLAGPFNVPPSTEIVWAGLWNGSVYLDKAPAFVSTIAQESVTILSLYYVVPESDPDVTA